MVFGPLGGGVQNPHKNVGRKCKKLNNGFIFSCSSSPIPAFSTDWFIPINSKWPTDWQLQLRTFDQTTPNFLSNASWSLYEIRQPLTCLWIASNFHINATLRLFHTFGNYLRTDRTYRTDRTNFEKGLKLFKRHEICEFWTKQDQFWAFCGYWNLQKKKRIFNFPPWFSGDFGPPFLILHFRDL